MVRQRTTVEFWRTLPSWWQLPATERNTLREEINRLFIHCFDGNTAANIPHWLQVSSKEWLVIWGVPEQQADCFREAVKQLGWPRYFVKLAYTSPDGRTATDYFRKLEPGQVALPG
jgi:hypothetical protein